MISNTSTSSCYLNAYPGVALLDASGHDLQDARRSTDSFFGTYPAPRRVDILPGGTSIFDLTYTRIDPCADNVPAERPAKLKITLPDDFDSATILASINGQAMSVCPSTLTVHPIGSKPQLG